MPASRFKSEEGWTLPYTWILLVIIIGLVYFFGWQVLLGVAALFALITLGVFIFDYLTGKPKFDELCFWFVSDRLLTTIWDLLAPVLKTADYDLEGENVWEWIDTSSLDHKYIFNITRQHKDLNHPVILRVKYRPENWRPDLHEEIGQQLADTLQCEVSTGTVAYINGNKYAFKPDQVYTDPK